jgi:Holliday junction resolvase-like predicted endonuclease
MNKKLKKLPIGIQTFSKIREEDYIYIDKTKEAFELIDNYSYAFLSRPRRFGKSLFLDTLHNIFEGKKEYFKDLYIYDKWDWSITYPVIKISWDGNLQTSEDVEQKAKSFLLENQNRLGISCESDLNMSVCFERLIKEAHDKYNQKVVILIDEYDRPILDTIDNLEQAKLNREFIKGMYSVMKGCDQYIKFAFLTGVSKFSKASIFSGLNMLTDISIDEPYGNICGYTQNHIENINLEVILYQSGYLTIDKMQLTPFETIEYKLKLPNKEVKISFNDMIINYITKNSLPTIKSDIYMALLEKNLDKFKDAFVSIFASIPYNNFVNNSMQNYEGFYASVVYIYLQSLGVEIIGEDVTNLGRIDLTVKIQNLIYIIEFKVGTENALKQIKEKHYHQKYINENKDIYLVGINFDKNIKNISSFVWEVV